MIYRRKIEPTLARFTKFPVVGVFGPRQSGKTTLVKNIFKKHTYLNFENLDIRSFATENPQGFLKQYENEFGLILDEFQYVPQILSYIQLEADNKNRPGYFVLTGSQNFLMNEAVTQSLAGRIGILTLLPLSIKEMQDNNILTDNFNELVFKGGYPRIYSQDFLPTDLYPSYIQSYVERDIRQLVNVENLETFQKFMQLCAGRIGQLLNISDLATNCGIAQKTAQSWISILSASYIILLLSPYHGSFNKRVVKTQKIYFYDTGLACSLLKIRSSDELALSAHKGHLFECLMITDMFKQYFSLGSRAPLYFWRDKNGIIEIDCITDLGIKQIPIEIKSGENTGSDYFSSITKWNELTQSDPSSGYIIYGGMQNQIKKSINIVSWQSAGGLIDKIEGKQ